MVVPRHIPYTPPSPNPSLNNTQTKLAEGRGGVFSAFRARRHQGRGKRRSDPADGRVSGQGDGDRGKGASAVRELEGERLTTTEATAAAATPVAAGAVGDGGRSAVGDVAGGTAASETSGAAPATYEGEEVLPETWAKVRRVLVPWIKRRWGEYPESVPDTEGIPGKNTNTSIKQTTLEIRGK